MIESQITQATMIGNGSATSFNTGIKAYDEDTIEVYEGTLTAFGTLMTLDTDYTLSGVSDYDADGLNSDDTIVVTLTTAPASGVYIRAKRVTPATQTVSILGSRAFDPAVIEAALDRLVMMAGERATDTVEAIRVFGKTNQVVVPQVGGILGFDADGNITNLSGFTDVPVASWLEPYLLSANIAAFRNVFLPVASWLEPFLNSADPATFRNSLDVEEVAASRFNKLINSDFSMWQRGTSLSAASGYQADGWAARFISIASTAIFERVAFPLTDSIGRHTPQYFARIQASSAGSGTKGSLEQRIPDVRTYAGQTISVLFYLKRSSFTPANIAVDLEQNFGSGGSTSVFVTPVTVAITDNWVACKATFTVPSVAGKTIGTNSYLALNFWFSGDASVNSRTNNLPNQNIHMDIANVHIVAGNPPADHAAYFIPKSRAENQLDCFERYRIIPHHQFVNGASNNSHDSRELTPEMLKTPTLTLTSSTATNVSAFTGDNITTRGFRTVLTSTGAGNGTWIGTIAIDGDF